jgi:hypothetical protein
MVKKSLEAEGEKDLGQEKDMEPPLGYSYLNFSDPAVSPDLEDDRLPEISEGLYLSSEEYNRIFDEYNRLPEAFTLFLPYFSNKTGEPEDEFEDEVPSELRVWNENEDYSDTLTDATETVKSKNLEWTDIDQKKLMEKLIWIYS